MLPDVRAPVARPASLHRREEPSRDALAEVTGRVETPAWRVPSQRVNPSRRLEGRSVRTAKAEGAPDGSARLD